MKRQLNNGKLTAAYCRLSSDDKDKDESNSISTQKKIISAYAAQNDFKNLTYFIDDGITGTRFDRPGYVAMMEEVEAGNVDTVIIKDLSRAGRDHIRVGLFTETLDRSDVRFIAVSDNVDSAKGYDDLVPFKNIFNEWFVRDCSRKVAAAYRAKGNEGKHTGSHPLYGYIHSPDDKGQWIIDEPAAEIVRRIFRMTVEGKGSYQIATILQGEKIFCPSYYLAQQGVGNRKNKDFPDPYRWWGTTVTCLLSRMEYMGHTVNFKTYKTSYKDKNRKRAPQDKWAVFENTHEAIIDPETWETAQRLMQTVRRVYENHGEPNRLTGLLYCADCGGKLYHERGMKGNGKLTKNNYLCSSYRKHTTDTDCTMHYIGVEVLEKLILDALKEISGYVKANKDEFIRSVTEMSSAYQAGEEKANRKRLTESEKRIAELDRLIRGIYEDKIAGTLSEKRFVKLSEDYEREQDELERSIADLRAEIDRLDAQSTRADKFVNVVNRYADFEELTTPMLNEFVEKIIVHERVKEYRYKNSQTIDIYFNFVGMFELPGTKMTVVNDKCQTKKYVAETTSFTPLAEYLERQDAAKLTMSFSEVEDILGRSLCASARKFKSYWYPAYNRPISNVIYNSGYDVGTVDLKSQTITLTKPEIIREEGA